MEVSQANMHAPEAEEPAVRVAPATHPLVAAATAPVPHWVAAGTMHVGQELVAAHCSVVLGVSPTLGSQYATVPTGWAEFSVHMF